MGNHQLLVLARTPGLLPSNPISGFRSAISYTHFDAVSIATYASSPWIPCRPSRSHGDSQRASPDTISTLGGYGNSFGSCWSSLTWFNTCFQRCRPVDARGIREETATSISTYDY